jgi:hypothetical protein
VAGSQKWLRYHCPGVFGGERCTKTETVREQSNAGEFPKTLRPSRASNHAYPWTQNMNSLYLWLNTFPSRPSCIKLNPDIARISFFPFSHCSTLDYSNTSLLFFTNFNYLHRNLTDIFFNFLFDCCWNGELRLVMTERTGMGRILSGRYQQRIPWDPRYGFLDDPRILHLTSPYVLHFPTP